VDLPSGYELPLDPSGRVKNFLVVLMNFVLVCLIQPNETFLRSCKQLAVARKELEQKTRLVHGICKRLEEEDDLRTQDVLSVSHVLVRVIQVL